MCYISLISIIFSFTKFALLNIDPFFGYGTIYSKGYTENGFNKVYVGMTSAEVEEILGVPLRKLPWSGGVDENWVYSEPPHDLANYSRRWLFFRDNTVVVIFNDFWLD